MVKFGLTHTLGQVGDILGRTGKKGSGSTAVEGAEDHGHSAGYDPVTGKETEMTKGAPVEDEKYPKKECDFNGLMLGNQTGRWSPQKHDIRWAFDHSLHGKQVHVWWPGLTNKGECNNLSDKSRGCWFRARLLSDPECILQNRCLHVALHDGEPVHTFTCPKWIKDDEGAVCKLPLSWQACPPKFHVARVDTGIPQFLKEAKMNPCELNEGEQLFVGKWVEPNSTVLYTVRKTDMAQLEVVVEPHGHDQAPPAIPGFPVPEEPPPPTESQLLRRGQPRSEELPGFGLGAALRKALGGLGKKDKDEKLKGILLLDGEWMRAKLMNEFDTATGAEVKMQIDENGSLLVSFKKSARDKWHDPVVAMRNIRTTGGTAQGAPCMLPFTHKGITYNDCTTVDQDKPWCRTDMFGNWGFCEKHGGRKQPAIVGTHGGSFEGAGPNCHFPFQHNNTVYKSCKVIGDLAQDGLVCQTDSEGTWGYCNCKVRKEPGGVVKTHGGDAKGAKCKFPFTYEGKTYNKCKDFGDGAPACITDDKGHWGYCNCKKPLHLLGPGGVEEEGGSTP